MKSSKDLKIEIISAGREAVAQLIKAAKEDIIKYDKDDAFEILTRIELEKDLLNGVEKIEEKSRQGFAERRSK